jgi:hypothetical protein
MTARQRLDRRMHWIRIFTRTGFGLMVAGALVMKLLGDQGTALAVILSGFAIGFAVSIVGHFIVFRCTCCGGNLGPLFMHGAFIRMAARVCFCPYCGAGLEDESTLDDHPGEQAPQQTTY